MTRLALVQSDLDWGFHNWDPAEHPRDRRGRFTKSRTSALTDDEKARGNAVIDGFTPRTFATDAEAAAYLAQDRDPPLTDDQIAGVESYTGDAFLRVNQQLRAAGESDEYPTAEVRAAMRPTPDDLILTRSVGLDAFGDVPLDELVGKKVMDAAFSSTSLGIEYSQFAGVRMKIAVPAGTAAVFAAPHSLNPHEREIILDAGTEFAVASVTERDPVGYDMTLVVLPPDDAPSASVDRWFARWRRPSWAAADADLDAVQDDWEQALDDVMSDWPGILADQRAEIHDQVQAAIDDGDTEALADITVDTTAAAAALKTALVALSETAADRVVEEAAAQDVTIDPVPAEAAAMAGVAAVTAAVLGAGLAAAAAREALRINSDEATGEQVADDVDTYLAGLSDATPRAQIGGALTNAQNTSRIATFAAGPKATYVASEVNDVNRCSPCGDIDGTEWDDIADVIAAYPAGGYVGCLGRERCRGMPVADWSGTTPEEAQEAELAAEARSLPAPAALAPWLRANGHRPTLPVG